MKEGERKEVKRENKGEIEEELEGERKKWREIGKLISGTEAAAINMYIVPAADRIGIVNGSHSPWSLLECREV